MESVDCKKKIMFVCITRSFTGKPGFENRKDKAYECTQKYWVLKGDNLIKAQKADYICGTSECEIKGIYKNTSGWKRVKEFENMKNDPEVVGFSSGKNQYPPHPEYLDRYAFEGEEISDKKILDRYFEKRIPEECKHNQNKVVSFNF